MGFFYISAPYLQNSREATQRQISDVVLKKSIADGQEIYLETKKFKLANLDTLMMVNDKLLKLQGVIQSFLKRVDKQYLDLQGKQSHQWLLKSGDRQYTISKYLYQFKWNDSKYPRQYTLLRIAEIIQSKVATFQSQLRSRVNAFNQTKTQLSQNTLKQGTYAARDLTDLLVQPKVTQQDFVQTKFISTLIAIVPTSSCQEFQQDHGIITDYVVPGSAKKFDIPDKDGLTVWKVNIFKQRTQEQEKKREQMAQEEEQDKKDDARKKKIDNAAQRRRNQTTTQQFIQRAKQQMRVTAKQFKFQSGLADKRQKKKLELQTKLGQQNKAVSDICLAYFAESYELYGHAKILRLVVQTNMRFGSDSTVFYVIQTIPGKEKNVLTLMVDIFGDKESQGLYGTKDQIDQAEDFFPFIYIPMLTI